MRLVDVYATAGGAELLWELLKERTPGESISHREMPTFEQHLAFVDSRPYLRWYLIMAGESHWVGACYLSKQREIGVFLFKRHRQQGKGKKAVKMLMALHPGKFLANVNPGNLASARLFTDIGFRHIQDTYAF